MSDRSRNRANAEGKLDAALEKADAALKLVEDVNAHLLVGNLLARTQKGEDALKHFQRAVQLDPRNVVHARHRAIRVSLHDDAAELLAYTDEFESGGHFLPPRARRGFVVLPTRTERALCVHWQILQWRNS